MEEINIQNTETTLHWTNVLSPFCAICYGIGYSDSLAEVIICRISRKERALSEGGMNNI